MLAFSLPEVVPRGRRRESLALPRGIGNMYTRAVRRYTRPCLWNYR